MAKNNLAKAVITALNLWGKLGLASNTMFLWSPKSVHPKQDLDPSSHVSTAKPYEAA